MKGQAMNQTTLTEEEQFNRELDQRALDSCRVSLALCEAVADQIMMIEGHAWRGGFAKPAWEDAAEQLEVLQKKLRAVRSALRADIANQKRAA